MVISCLSAYAEACEGRLCRTTDLRLAVNSPSVEVTASNRCCRTGILVLHHPRSVVDGTQLVDYLLHMIYKKNRFTETYNATSPSATGDRLHSIKIAVILQVPVQRATTLTQLRLPSYCRSQCNID